MPGMNLAYDHSDNDIHEENDNRSYDLNKYRRLSSETENVGNISESHNKITMKSRNADRSNAAKIIALAVAALVLLFCVVYGKVQVSDMYSKINAQKTALTVAQSENARLKAELEASTSLRNVEEYAESIGLKKLDKAQIWYVDIQNEDVIKIPDNNDVFAVKFKKWFMSVIDNFECLIS